MPRNPENLPRNPTTYDEAYKQVRILRAMARTPQISSLLS